MRSTAREGCGFTFGFNSPCSSASIGRVPASEYIDRYRQYSTIAREIQEVFRQLMAVPLNRQDVGLATAVTVVT